MLPHWPSPMAEIVHMEVLTSGMIVTTCSDNVMLLPYTASCKITWILACTEVSLSVQYAAFFGAH